MVEVWSNWMFVATTPDDTPAPTVQGDTIMVGTRKPPADGSSCSRPRKRDPRLIPRRGFRGRHWLDVVEMTVVLVVGDDENRVLPVTGHHGFDDAGEIAFAVRWKESRMLCQEARWHDPGDVRQIAILGVDLELGLGSIRGRRRIVSRIRGGSDAAGHAVRVLQLLKHIDANVAERRRPFRNC